MNQFVHLHVHSEYSLLDGACRVDSLCRRAANDGAPGVALTDHGVMYGAMEFYYAARGVSLTPIVGCEAYIAPRGRFDRTVRDEAHVTLLAADLVGYRNLSALVSKGFLEGYYYKPRIDLDLLAEHHDGLIVLSGCMSGLVAAPLLKNDYATALKSAKTYVEIFGDRFYIEVMRHGMPEEEIINSGLVRIARELNVPIVATNDSHYLEQKDASAHDVLLCIGTGKTVSDSSRMRFYSDAFYVKSAQEMYELWSDLPEACENTVKIAERIDIRIPEKIFHLPEYPVPQVESTVEKSDNEYLREVCEIGLVERYGQERVRDDAALRERFEYEIGIITKMGFSSYFLIVWDFIKYARDNGIPVGPGRGSAVGSIVAYCLRITDLDPLQFNLFFERFLNPDRISMPDIDTDFCVERRDEVIAYVTEKYGKDRVAQIVTFGTMAARAAIRDAGRALGVPLPDVDRVAKLIPSGPTGLSIEQAVEQLPELKSLYNMRPDLRKLVDTAKEIEGLARNAGTHAAGVVISAGPLIDYAPLVRFNDGGINTQYDMEWIERIGLLKMDFLGLRNLTVMDNAVKEIRRTNAPEFDLARIPIDDARTFDMLGRGETMGVFQLESDGMKRVCTELKPTRFEDIIALVALYRPGPMDWIPDYIAIKNGRRKPHYLHPKLEPILSETYGIACLRKGTRISLADGSQKNIEDLNGSETLLTGKDGYVAPAKMAKMWPSGKKKILRITLSSGSTIDCSEEHRFPTPDGVVQAKDLVVARRTEGSKFAYSTRKSVLFEQRPESTNDRTVGGKEAAWLLGCLVGDGCLAQKGSRPVTCRTKKNAENVAAAFETVFGCKARMYHHTRAWYVYPNCNSAPKKSAMTLWLDSMYGGSSWIEKSGQKHLPDFVVNLREKERAALLAGLWDADGSYASAGIYFRTTSPRMRDQISRLLATFKIAHYVRPTAIVVQDADRFVRTVGMPRLQKVVVARKLLSTLPVLSKRLHENLAEADVSSGYYPKKIYTHAAKDKSLVAMTRTAHYINHIPGMRQEIEAACRETYQRDLRPVYIDKIEVVGEDDCYDVQMEDQSNPYFLANGILTHNCYQEQVMQIARDVAGFTMGEADELRKVMGKKQKDKIPVYKEKFIKGAIETSDIDAGLADSIFKFVEPFAGYGFNKSHAAAYGWIAYQTAYLKANHPLQYLTALMTSVKDKTDKMVEYLDEAKKLRIEVLPPDVNASLVDFAVVGERIAFGLAAIKGVGEGAVRSIIAAREAGGAFVDVFDLARRVDGKQVNRRVFEALIKCGALDGLPGNRAQNLAALDAALELAARATRDTELGQVSLFGDAAANDHASLAPKLPIVPAPTKREMLAWEKETLGIFVSGHPLADIQHLLVRQGATPFKDLQSLEDDCAVTVSGLVTGVRRTMTKTGQQILIAQLEDTTGSCEAIVFAKLYPTVHELFAVDAILTVKGRLRLRERRGAPPGEEPPLELSVSVLEVTPFVVPLRISPLPAVHAPRAWHVDVDRREQIDRLAALIDEWPGDVPVFMHARGRCQRVARTIGDEPGVRGELEAIFGPAGVSEGAPEDAPR